MLKRLVKKIEEEKPQTRDFLIQTSPLYKGNNYFEVREELAKEREEKEKREKNQKI